MTNLWLHYGMRGTCRSQRRVVPSRAREAVRTKRLTTVYETLCDSLERCDDRDQLSTGVLRLYLFLRQRGFCRNPREHPPLSQGACI
ncbi:hypothetical protein Ddc_20953 [Ditylenchus destructor]|nr:hypothetical protein Ddc_20953 [Ditylenchus destructor]